MQSQNTSQACGLLLPGHPFQHSSGALPGLMSYMMAFMYTTAARVVTTPPKNKNGNFPLTGFASIGFASAFGCLNGRINFSRSYSQHSKNRLANNINVVTRVPSKRTE